MSSMPSSEHHRVIVIGAGFSGLAAAKTYLAIDPSIDILIVDEDSAAGGVWSASRIYPGLDYEAPTPMMNFSDFDICEELRLDMWADVTGYQLNEFLVRYARKFDLLKRCQLNTEVVTIKKSGTGWGVLVRPKGDPDADFMTLTCDKLVVATGLNSTPMVPDHDMSKFDGCSFHAMEMSKRHKELVANEVEHVTIIGGHKSALEAVGTAAQAGKKVEWLIREDGGGPTWMMTARRPDGSSMVKMATKRAMKVVQTSVYHSDGWLDRFIYSGRWRLGTWFVTWFWGFMTREVQQDRYEKSENGRKLKPDPESFFWLNPGATVLHDRDIETLRLVDEENLIRVNRASMISATGRSVTLSTGETIKTDAVIFCTGWELTAPPLFAASLANDLGIPVDPTAINEEEREYWASLDFEAEKRIVESYPVLKSPPDIHMKTTGLTPFRLFRSIVPSKLAHQGDNSIVFLGNYVTGRLQSTAEINSLWAIGYLEGLLPASTKEILSNKSAMDKDIAHNEAYRKKRYLCGLPVRLTIMETPEFDDLMLNDLGVRPDRKAMKLPTGWRGWFGLQGWLAEWFDSYFSDDFEGIIEEFLESVEKRGREAKQADERIPLMNGVKKLQAESG